MKKFLAIVLALVMVASLGVCAFADYPDKAINLIVPYNPGGTTDLTARAIANGMSDFLGVTINVNNVAGAGGSVGSLQVENGKNDGYTILANGMLAEIGTFGLQPMLRMQLLFRQTAPTRQLLTWWRI